MKIINNKKDIIKPAFTGECGEVMSINISKEKGVKKIPVKEAFIGIYGIEGDGHSGQWHRQVSFLAFESMEEINKKGVIKVLSGDFAENITTKNINLKDLKIGDDIVIESIKGRDNLKHTSEQPGIEELKVNKKVILEVTQIGKECHNPCRIFYEMGSCIMPQEGIFCKVINTGKIKTGDRIYVLSR